MKKVKGRGKVRKSITISREINKKERELKIRGRMLKIGEWCGHWSGSIGAQ